MYNLDTPIDAENQPAKPEARPCKPDDKALPLRSPYFDLEYGGFELTNRYHAWGILWAHVGAYLGERVHVTGRVGVAQADVEERTEQDGPDGFGSVSPDDQDAPALFGSLGVGYVFTTGGSFVFAPNLMLLLSENNDFGYAAGVMVPFIWGHRRGFRFGFQVSLLYGFGGSVRYTCTDLPPNAPCDAGEVRTVDRQSDSGYSLGVIFGYGAD